MTNTKDIILKLKAIRIEKSLSFGDILDLMEKNGDYLSKSTLSRVFSDGSEDLSFRYEETLRPIADALLDLENIEETDGMDVQAMKSLLKYKMQRIEELEQQVEHLEATLAKEKLRSHEKLDEERARNQRSLDFLKEQVALKDQRMDGLLEAVRDKDEKYGKLLELILSCPCRKKAEGKTE